MSDLLELLGELLNPANNAELIRQAKLEQRFSIGDRVKSSSGEGEVWKVTEESVHVRVKNTGQYGKNPNEYFYSKYLKNPWHHSQSNINELSLSDDLHFNK